MDEYLEWVYCGLCGKAMWYSSQHARQHRTHMLPFYGPYFEEGWYLSFQCLTEAMSDVFTVLAECE